MKTLKPVNNIKTCKNNLSWRKFTNQRGDKIHHLDSAGLYGGVLATPNLEADTPLPASADLMSITFGDEKTAWRGFNRYDFVMDENSLEIKPIKAQEDEKDGIEHTAQGQRQLVSLR